ncbi:nucleoside diphosphate-linked moiety X motif 8 [Sceloporus undulatus]|uniref:nucleoside diphosphate-linked moiety X motif 8 n=1 Tax=Sceloporus undulatus TaxID=8520 RepID=UPI001C4BB46E|nr:nucleoside diphosphate-linked moiety X motif 8 [Sceloporus undulatus]XP_042301959.1 nucleoside diphosphate-linked moiety X motif 8 [Sceloporus undulatus]XP_042301960.1 nucleoside diphosphate-linked moiety X motif 8 [Sceloporus undulatus]XP_042301961.1 nucleoside diphosphate-linked moiety X motif 8 [Sceloporus undulatus]XP_042301962.1 nucleoside diphosphate-linked moiety X motif 8 [Sceloporus undulatus]XP_042301963.1 nucleoside diphosphate-linked moiety X motif 8 [Sceloporus undulatus]XP_04
MLLILRHLCQGMTPVSITSISPVRRYLSWENEQRCRGLLEASTKRHRQEAASAAVLVSLCTVAGEPAVLYTLRSSTLSGLHKGDVSFPGGRCDDSDRDVIATALRETREELGLQLGEDSVWGIMRPLPDKTKMMVVPVLANLGPLEQLILKPNPKEVEAVFTLSISHLLKEENQGYTHFCRNGVYSYTMPVFPRGPHRVWGLTAIITELTLELLAPGKYQRRTRVLGSR